MIKLSFADIFWMFWLVDSKTTVDSGVTSIYKMIHIFASKVFIFNLAVFSLLFPFMLKQKFSGVMLGDVLSCYYIAEICSHLERKGVSREFLAQLAKEAIKEGN